MDTQQKSNGWHTSFEHWWFLLIAVVAFASSQLLSFFMNLAGKPWIWCYAIGLGIAAVGVALMLYAKMPLYRHRRFFTFGSEALPESRRAFYCWGYRCVIFSVVLLLCSLLSRP